MSEEKPSADRDAPSGNPKDKRYSTEAENLRRILVTNLEDIVWKYRSLETYTYLYDYLNGCLEIRIKLSIHPPEVPINKSSK